MSYKKWFIHSFIRCYQNFEEKTRFNQTLLFSSQTFPTVSYCFLPSSPAPQRRRGFHFLLPDPWPTFLESHPDFPPGNRRVVEGINDGKMSKKHFAVWWLHLTLNSPKIRSQTACNLIQTATRKNMALKHSFNKNTPCNTVRSVKPNFEIAIPTYWYAIQPTTQQLRCQLMLPWIY